VAALVRDVLWRVSDLLQDVKPQYARYPERSLVRWLNDAQVAVVKYLPTAGARNDILRLRAGTLQSIESIQLADLKPLTGLAPTQVVKGTTLFRVRRNQGADGLSTGRTIKLVDGDELEAFTPDWHTSSKAIIKEYVYDPRNPLVFYVNPGVPPTGWWALVEYAALPDPIAAGGAPGSELYALTGANVTTVGLPDENLDELVNYVCARALMQESNVANDASAATFVKLFTDALDNKRQQLTGSNPNLQRLPFAGTPDGQAS
jgi:hypothetical protein